MYIILMATHKGQTKYCITLNDEDSNIVKITRAKPGTIPGRWHTEEEVKLDSISQDVYGTSKQNVEKMFQEIAESKEDEEAESKEDDVAESKEDDVAESKEDEVAESKEDEVAESKEDEEAESKEDEVAESKDDEVGSTINIVEDDNEEAKRMKERAAHSRALTDAIAARREQIGEGRRTRKNKKRTTRKKNRKGPHSKSNKNKRKHTRGKK